MANTVSSSILLLCSLSAFASELDLILVVLQQAVMPKVWNKIRCLTPWEWLATRHTVKLNLRRWKCPVGGVMNYQNRNRSDAKLLALNPGAYLFYAVWGVGSAFRFASRITLCIMSYPVIYCSGKMSRVRLGIGSVPCESFWRSGRLWKTADGPGKRCVNTLAHNLLRASHQSAGPRPLTWKGWMWPQQSRSCQPLQLLGRQQRGHLELLHPGQFHAIHSGPN